MTDRHDAALTAAEIHFGDIHMIDDGITIPTMAQRWAFQAAEIACPSTRQWMLTKAASDSHPCGHHGHWYAFPDRSTLTIQNGVLVVS
jgi:hypothetical protein